MKQIDNTFYGADLTGFRSGRLTVKEFHHRSKTKPSAKWKYFWTCTCDCGNECVVEGSRLKEKVRPTRSCGCLNRERMGKTALQPKRVVPEKVQRWILKHFAHTKNQEIIDKFSLTHGWLHRFARAHGLKKTPQFMAKCQKELNEAARKSHLRNGTYPPKGYVIPGSVECRFEPGHHRTDRTPEAKKARLEKSAATRRELYRMERIRAKWGLPRKSKLRVIAQPRHAILLRSYLRTRGYIIARGSSTAYYTDATHRSPAIEARKKGDKNYVYFDFKPIKNDTAGSN